MQQHIGTGFAVFPAGIFHFHMAATIKCEPWQINEIMFFEAFERDVDLHDSYPQSAWPDLEAGDVTCVFEEDEAISVAF